MSTTGEYLGALRDARRCRELAAQEADPVKRAELLRQAAEWEEQAEFSRQEMVQEYRMEEDR